MAGPTAGFNGHESPPWILERCGEVSICDLNGAEQFLVWAIRWRACWQDDEAFASDCLRDSFGRAGMPEAHPALEQFVCATCPMRLACPPAGRLGCWRLNVLEAHALHAAACLEDGLLGEAWRALRVVCPGKSLQSALESLHELGRAITRNGGSIRRWRFASASTPVPRDLH
jgi:hypothetical protein